MPDFAVSDVARLMRHANMSATYKPALLKALVRVCRASDALQISLEALGDEFAKMYWNQTVIFHLRQAASLTKEAEVIKAVRVSAQKYNAREFTKLPTAGKADLSRRMARILPINVLSAFHKSKPADMRELYHWSKEQNFVTLTTGAQLFLKHQGAALETIANYHWASFLESTNRLAPRIIQKVERDGARRGPLTPYLRMLVADGEDRCFYCARTFEGSVRPTVDHVIPWSFLLEDPLWDLVLACPSCNCSKSDRLPDPDYLDRLLRRNHALARNAIAKTASMLIKSDEITRLYDAAVSVEWPKGWAPTQ